MAEAGQFWGRAALTLGLASLVPLAGAGAVLPASLAALASLWISRGHPERRDLRVRAWVGLSLALAGSGLAVGEFWGFMAWKRQQAASQRVAVTRMRLRALQDLMEEYRASEGVYPTASSTTELEAALASGAAVEVTLADGWGCAFAVRSEPSGYTVRASSPAIPPVGAMAPLPLSAPSQALSASTAELTMPPAQPEPSPTR